MALGLRVRGVPRGRRRLLGADTVLFGRDLIVREARAHLWVEAYLKSRAGRRSIRPAGREIPVGGRAGDARAALDV